jgi:tetratricopeptide (TPR) repeat protein
LLKQAVDEDLNDDRNAFYYARELYFYNKYPESAAEFKRHLSLERATWKPERAASMRYLAKVEPDKAESWLRLAIQEAPDRREAYFDLAQYYYGIQDWKECLEACKSLLQITEKPLEYLCEEKAWGYLPFDLAAISSFYLGKLADAESYNLKAMALNPDDDRLKNNHIFYTSSK